MSQRSQRYSGETHVGSALFLLPLGGFALRRFL
jgi:hypothetical protein